MRGMLGTIGFIGVIAWSAPVVGLTSISAYKTFTRELLTSSDLNSSFTRVINGVNNLNAKFPGDSVKVGTAAMDSAVANPGPSITFKSPLASVAAEDSLIFHRANLKRVHTDSLFVGPVPVTAPSWAIGVTAGRQSHFSYADIDSVVINSTFSIGTTAVTATDIGMNRLRCGARAHLCGFGSPGQVVIKAEVTTAAAPAPASTMPAMIMPFPVAGILSPKRGSG